MIERLILKKQPDENLIMDFIVRAGPEDADMVLLRFTEYVMRSSLKAKRDQGFSGWNTPQVENSDLLARLKKNLEQGDYVDVINLAAMLNARKNMFNEKHLGVKK